MLDKNLVCNVASVLVLSRNKELRVHAHLCDYDHFFVLSDMKRERFAFVQFLEDNSNNASNIYTECKSLSEALARMYEQFSIDVDENYVSMSHYDTYL